MGVELDYEDIWGQQRKVAFHTVAKLLEALSGAGKASIWVWETEQVRREFPHEVWDRELRSASSWQIRWENGAVSQGPLTSSRIAELATHGYHKIAAPPAEGAGCFPWILTPSACYQPEGKKHYYGLNCFLPALRSKRNWGAGDLTDLQQLARWLRPHLALDFIGVNPLHAIHNRVPYNTSPYLPLSLFARNFLAIDVEACPEFARSKLAQALFHSDANQNELKRLRELPFVDYEAVARRKQFFLLLLYREYLRREGNEVRDYEEQHAPWLAYFCRYLALDRHLHKRDPQLWHWQQWPAPYQDPHSAEVEALLPRLKIFARFHAFVQMRLEEQLAQTQAILQGLGYTLGLYHDLALATDRVGADTWAHNHLFAKGVRVGSPPDDFNQEGQDWGFPAIDPNRHAANGYTYFRESLRTAASYGGMVRLDHVMRLARLYWIPDGQPTRDGAYVRDHLLPLLRILALESQRQRFAVVGEDLGTVPRNLRQALEDFRVMSYRLVLFERHHGQFLEPSAYPAAALAAFTTHDLPTFDGWLAGQDLELRHQLGHLDPSQFQQAMANRAIDIKQLRHAFGLPAGTNTPTEFFAGFMQFLSRTPSQMKLVNLEELLSETQQQNLPGTTGEHPNWQRKIRIPIEDFEQDPQFNLRLRLFEQAIHPEGDTACAP